MLFHPCDIQNRLNGEMIVGMILVWDEVFVVVFLASEIGYLSAVALVVENRDVGDDLIDAFCCQFV